MRFATLFALDLVHMNLIFICSCAEAPHLPLFVCLTISIAVVRWITAHIEYPDYIKGIFELQCEIALKNLKLSYEAHEQGQMRFLSIRTNANEVHKHKIKGNIRC